ncbi:MAG: Hpt domain-containing protein, partial [Candidatus Marinimicrobia bacterium]|nr:Hpt domain-containing protein [Candidatus Neomarinimicrobiota bacterium]
LQGIDTRTGLKRVAGNKQLYARILSLFATENKNLIEILKNHLARKDTVAAEHLTHALKGSAGNIGAQNLYKIVTDLDKELKSEQYDSVKIGELFRQVATELNLILDVIAKAKFPVEITTLGKSGETKKPKIDGEMFRKSVHELRKYLTEYDAQAGDAFQTLKEELLLKMSEAQLAIIEKDIEKYDYDQALAKLDEVINLN